MSAPIVSGAVALLLQKDPSLTPDQAKHVLGVEGNMWTEHAPQDRIDHMVFPRLSAIAEIGWSPKEARNWEDFSRRLQAGPNRRAASRSDA